MKLWIDDIRPVRNDWRGDVIIATNSTAAIWALEKFIIVENGVNRLALECISFDHDLGGDDTTRRVVMWCVGMNLWPRKCFVHTANPVGREWLEGMIKRYAPEGTLQ